MPYPGAGRRARRRTGSSPIKTSTTLQGRNGVPRAVSRPIARTSTAPPQQMVGPVAISQSPQPTRTRRRPQPGRVINPGTTVPGDRNYGPGGPTTHPNAFWTQPPLPDPLGNQTQVAPTTAQGQTLRANAEHTWVDAQTANRDAIYRAAMALGDQGILDQLKSNPEFAGYSFVVDPNSQMSQIGRDEATGLQNVDYDSNDRNAFFSGFRLKDRKDVSNAASGDRATAIKNYNDALAEYARILAGASSDFGQGMADADQTDIDAASAIDPQDLTSSPTPPPAATPSNKPAAAPKNKGKKKGKKKNDKNKAKNVGGMSYGK